MHVEQQIYNNVEHKYNQTKKAKNKDFHTIYQG